MARLGLYRRTPLNPVGNYAKRRGPQQAETRKILKWAAKGRCMVCGAEETEFNYLEHQHVFGRSMDGVPAEVLDSPAAGLAVGHICCHPVLTNPVSGKTHRTSRGDEDQHALVERLQWEAYERITHQPGDQRQDVHGALRQWWKDQSLLETDDGGQFHG